MFYLLTLLTPHLRCRSRLKKYGASEASRLDPQLFTSGLQLSCISTRNNSVLTISACVLYITASFFRYVIDLVSYIIPTTPYAKNYFIASMLTPDAAKIQRRLLKLCIYGISDIFWQKKDHVYLPGKEFTRRWFNCWRRSASIELEKESVVIWDCEISIYARTRCVELRYFLFIL